MSSSSKMTSPAIARARERFLNSAIETKRLLGVKVDEEADRSRFGGRGGEASDGLNGAPPPPPISENYINGGNSPPSHGLSRKAARNNHLKYTENDFREKVRQAHAQYAALHEKRMAKQVEEHRARMTELRGQYQSEHEQRMQKEKEVKYLLEQHKAAAVAHEERLMRLQSDANREIASSRNYLEENDALKAECARLSAELINAKSQSAAAQELVEAERRRVTTTLKEQYKNIIKMYQNEAKAAAYGSKSLRESIRTQQQRADEEAQLQRQAFEARVAEHSRSLVEQAHREQEKVKADLFAMRQKFHALEAEMTRQFEMHCAKFEASIRAKASEIVREESFNSHIASRSPAALPSSPALSSSPSSSPWRPSSATASFSITTKKTPPSRQHHQRRSPPPPPSSSPK